MKETDALGISQGFLRMALWAYFVFLLISVVFAGVTVFWPEVHETLAYDDRRKMMSIGYTLISVTLLLLVLRLNGRSNAALKYGQASVADGGGAEPAPRPDVFRPLSALWALFFMTAIIIAVNYTVLIYAVEGGIF